MRAMKTPLVAALLCALLLGATGCQYNQHRNLGNTEKWVASDVNYVTKIIGTPFLAIFDSFVSIPTMVIDHVEHDQQYHPDHRYFSYATSRTNGRSEMGHGYQWMVMFPTAIVDTVFLIFTGPIDLVMALGWSDDGDDEYGEHNFGPAYEEADYDGDGDTEVAYSVDTQAQPVVGTH